MIVTTSIVWSQQKNVMEFFGIRFSNEKIPLASSAFAASILPTIRFVSMQMTSTWITAGVVSILRITNQLSREAKCD